MLAETVPRSLDSAPLENSASTHGARWTELRMHSCTTCSVHTCWEPIGVGLTQRVWFLDAGHPGRHLPWRESYGDDLDGAVPLKYLWSAS